MRTPSRLWWLSALVVGLALKAHAESPVRTRVVIVGSNAAQSADAERLRFADDDAGSWARLFAGLTDEVELLTQFDAESRVRFNAWHGRAKPPTRAAVLAALARVHVNLRTDQDAGYVTRLFVVLIGHGALDAALGYLVMEGGERLSRDDLYEALFDHGFDPERHRTHLVIDACNAHNLVFVRGSGTAYVPRDPVLPSWAGAVLATSGVAAAYETDLFRGGVFSHIVRSGLLGPADVDGDGEVGYDELDSFIEGALARLDHVERGRHGVRPPTAGSAGAPIVRLADYRSPVRLRVGAAATGHYYLLDTQGSRVAEMHLAPDRPPFDVVVLDGVESVVRRGGDEGDRAARLPVRGRQVTLESLHFEPMATATRDIASALRVQLFATPVGLGFHNALRRRADERVRDAAATARPTLSVGWQFEEAPVSVTGGAAWLNSVDLRSGWRLSGGAAIEVVGRYGHASIERADTAPEPDFSDASLHRFFLGLHPQFGSTVGARWWIAGGTTLGLEHVALDLRSDTMPRQSSQVGVKAEGEVEAGVHLWRSMVLGARAGYVGSYVLPGGSGVDVETGTYVRHGDPRWTHHPQVGLFLRVEGR